MSGDPEKHWVKSPWLWERLRPASRAMRANPMHAESLLWSRLRNRQLEGLKFRRQHCIDALIVDFYCAEARLVVEVDGGVHTTTADRDAARDELFRELGLSVLHVRNDDVERRMEDTLARIADATRATSSAGSSSPSPLAERGPGGEARVSPGSPND